MTVQVQHLITEWKSNSGEAVQHKLYLHGGGCRSRSAPEKGTPQESDATRKEEPG